MLDFFAYRMHWQEGLQPNNKFDPVFWARRLSRQNAVKALRKVKENDLNYFRRTDSQEKRRAERYETLQRNVQEQANERGMKPDRLVILPSATFQVIFRKREMEMAWITF